MHPQVVVVIVVVVAVVVVAVEAAVDEVAAVTRSWHTKLIPTPATLHGRQHLDVHAHTHTHTQ